MLTANTLEISLLQYFLRNLTFMVFRNMPLKKNQLGGNRCRNKLISPWNRLLSQWRRHTHHAFPGSLSFVKRHKWEYPYGKRLQTTPIGDSGMSFITET